jgi:ATP-dependent helicase/nuclease subunit A
VSAAGDWRAQDDKARRLARREFEKPLLLAAGAGSGKTAALVARIAVWCLGPGWDRAVARLPAGAAGARAQHVLARCVAVTFTEKAAAEMEDRIGAALAGFAAGRTADEVLPGFELAEIGIAPDEAAVRAAALLDAFEHLRIGTLHAFCARLLREHALESGLHPSFEIDADESALARACREQVALGLPAAYGEPGDEHALALARARVGPEAVCEALQRLGADGVEGAVLRMDPCAPELVEQERRELAAELARAAELLRAALTGAKLKSNDGAPKALEALARAAAALAEPIELDALLAATRACEDTAGAALKKYAREDFSDGLAAALGANAGALAQVSRELAPHLAAVASCEPALVRAAASVLANALDELERTRRAAGLVTFHDLLARAAELLERAPHVAELVASGIDQLLVDEFQDTDRTQCRLLRALVLAQDPARRPGLFVVGDPKQSIYGFRGADLAAYAGFRRECEAAGRREARLEASFRSSAAILDEVGRLCRPHLVDAPGVQWPYEPLHEARPKAPHAWLADAPRAAIEYWSSWDATALDGTTSDAARRIEARAIAEDLAALRAERPEFRWRDAALLVRTSSALPIYLHALRERGIRCAPSKDRSFHRTSEVQELSNLLLAVLAPSDALALAGALRSGAVGAPDAALPRLWQRGLPEHWSRWRAADEARAMLATWCESIERELEREPDAAAAGHARIAGWSFAAADALATLLELRASFATERADRWVERWRAWLLLEEHAALGPLGPWRSANVARALDQLEAALAGDARAPHELARALREAQSGDREDAVAPPRGEEDAVAVLTLHAAKGLEWPLVYLPDLHHERGSGDRPRIEIAAAGARVPLRVAGKAGLGWRAHARRTEAVDTSEAARLLYVAATRATDRLVLLGRWPAPGQLESGAPLLDLVLRREGGASFDRVDSAQGFRDEHGVLWRLPGVHPAAQASANARAVGDAGSAFDAARLASDAQHYAAARAAARAHAARPRVAAITALVAHDDAEPSSILRPPSGVDPRVLGSLIHLAFEHTELDAPALRARLEAHARALGTADARTAVDEALELLATAGTQKLLARLAALGAHVLGREVPLLAPPRDGEGPTLARTGQVDLCYRDPADGMLVVADYKTDRDVDAAAARARHGPQLREYVGVLADALGRPVRGELWLVRSGEIVGVG